MHGHNAQRSLTSFSFCDLVQGGVFLRNLFNLLWEMGMLSRVSAVFVASMTFVVVVAWFFFDSNGSGIKEDLGAAILLMVSAVVCAIWLFFSKEGVYSHHEDVRNTAWITSAIAAFLSWLSVMVLYLVNGSIAFKMIAYAAPAYVLLRFLYTISVQDSNEA
jgi:hypothetical protein